MEYPTINRTEDYLIITIVVKKVIIITAKVENAADTIIKSTEINDNYITLTKTKLIFSVNNTVLKNIKLKIILITIL